MKTMNKTMVAGSLLVAVCATLFSFSSPKGGEGFEIFLNNKLVLQQFGGDMKTVKSVNIGQNLCGSQLSVKYFHCGKMGKDRSITIRNENNKVLKEWRFADVSSASVISDPSMNCKVSDILALQKNNSGKLNLYYSSSEIPKGRLLANLVCEGNNVVKH